MLVYVVDKFKRLLSQFKELDQRVLNSSQNSSIQSIFPEPHKSIVSYPISTIFSLVTENGGQAKGEMPARSNVWSKLFFYGL